MPAPLTPEQEAAIPAPTISAEDKANLRALIHGTSNPTDLLARLERFGFV